MGGGQSILSDNQTKQRNEIINKLYLKYQLNYILGEGGYSKVYHAINNETNNSVAVKKINLLKAIKENNLGIIETAFYELNAFKRIGNHDFIVTLHSAFRHNVCCYLVMDCLSGGDLRHFLKINGSLNEESVVYIVGCIGSALHHMHSRGVIHRDVKPENIGLDTLGRPYLTDFGISLISSVDNPIPISESSSGTLPYLSPEVLSPGNCHSHQSDYWSLGVLAYELFFNRRPYRRHCPIHAIEFVSNEYGWIWNELKKKQQQQQKYNPVNINGNNLDNNNGTNNNNNNSTNTNTNTHINTITNTNTTSATTTTTTISPTLLPSLPLASTNTNTIKSNYNPNMIDFTELNRPIDWKLPFPNLSLHLNEDGSVPSSLITSIPYSQSSYSSKIISEEFRSLLNGLLDVRIPYRLGNMSRYHEFNDHDCFLKHDYFLSRMSLISSPLRNYTIEFHPFSVSNNTNTNSNFNSNLNLNSNYFDVNKYSDVSVLSSYLSELSPETQRKLLQFYYLNSCFRENINLKQNNRTNHNNHNNNNNNNNLTTHKTEESITSRLTGRTIKSHDT